MHLNSYTAQIKRKIYDELLVGEPPSEGKYSENALQEAREKGNPQMGPTVFAPESITLEYIYPDGENTPLIFTVTLDAPERIVFMPVPDWVVETIWEGEIDGTYRFESEARELLDKFADLMKPEANKEEFKQKLPKTRK